MADLVEPLRVSPFIKFCRWSLLIAGIFYGSSRFQALSKKQKAIRDEYHRAKPERDARLKLERARKLEKETKELVEIIGSNP